MSYLRSIGAVAAGEVIFGGSAVLLFQLARMDPYAPRPSPIFMLFTTLYGAFFAALGGYVTARLAGRREMEHTAALVCLIILIAAGSLVAMLGKGTVWSEIATLVVMAPCAALGGLFRRRQTQRVAA